MATLIEVYETTGAIALSEIYDRQSLDYLIEATVEHRQRAKAYIEGKEDTEPELTEEEAAELIEQNRDRQLTFVGKNGEVMKKSLAEMGF